MSVEGVDVGQECAHHGRYARAQVLSGQAMEVRHGLVDGLDTEAHGELLDQFLGRIVEVHFPTVVSFGHWELDTAVVHLLREIMEQILVQASVLDVVRCHLIRKNGSQIKRGYL